MSATIFFCALGAVSLCTIHLFLGFWLGQSRAQQKRLARADDEPLAIPQMEAITAQLRERLADVVSLANQARALSAECSSTELELPAHIVLRADSIAHGSAVLQTNMESVTRLLPKRSEISESSDAPRTAQASTQQESFRDFEPIRTGRFPEGACQHVAPMYDGELPEASQFEPVQCRNLSREGFSYFVEDLPTAEMLVVAMGSPPNLRFFTARVASSPPVSRYGRVGHQIECKFVSKLEQLYEWDPNFGGIISALPAEMVARETVVS